MDKRRVHLLPLIKSVATHENFITVFDSQQEHWNIILYDCTLLYLKLRLIRNAVYGSLVNKVKIRPFQGREGGFESPRSYSIYREWKPSNRVGKRKLHNAINLDEVIIIFLAY